jgi:hypothetical protein
MLTYNPAKRKHISHIDGGGGCGAHDTALAAAEGNVPAKKKSKREGKKLTGRQRKKKAKEREEQREL